MYLILEINLLMIQAQNLAALKIQRKRMPLSPTLVSVLSSFHACLLCRNEPHIVSKKHFCSHFQALISWCCSLPPCCLTLRWHHFHECLCVPPFCCPHNSFITVLVVCSFIHLFVCLFVCSFSTIFYNSLKLSFTQEPPPQKKNRLI